MDYLDMRSHSLEGLANALLYLTALEKALLHCITCICALLYWTALENALLQWTASEKALLYWITWIFAVLYSTAMEKLFFTERPLKKPSFTG